MALARSCVVLAVIAGACVPSPESSDSASRRPPAESETVFTPVPICLDTPGPIPRRELPCRLATAICAVAKPCCDANALTFDGDRCRAEVTGKLVGLASSPPDDEVVYDGDAARLYFERLWRIAASCTHTPEDDADADRLLLLAIATRPAAGSVPPGEECTSNMECQPAPGGSAVCQSFLTDDGPELGMRSICVQTVPARAGLPCGASAVPTPLADCIGREATDLACIADMPDTWTCHPRRPIGSACVVGECTRDAYCREGTCAARSGPGTPCRGGGTEFAWDDACDDASFCDADRRCAAKRAAGEACSGFGTACTSGWCFHADPRDMSLPGRCLANDIGNPVVCHGAGGGFGWGSSAWPAPRGL